MSSSKAVTDTYLDNGYNKVLPMRGLALILLLAGCLSLLTGQAAQAQFEEKRQVRTTTHLVHTAGWEKDLIQRTPNLKHWSWHPIISYPQERGLVGPGYNGHLKSQTPRRSVYVKPQHVPTMVRTAVYAAPLPEWQTQLACNAPKPSADARNEVYGVLRSAEGDLPGKLTAQRKDVNAKLSRRVVAGSLATKDVAAGLRSADAGGRPTLGQRGLGGRLASRSVSGVLAYPEVYGTLANPAVDADLMSAGLRGALLGRNGTKEVFGRIKG